MQYTHATLQKPAAKRAPGGAGDNQGPAEAEDPTKTGTGTTPTLTVRRRTEAQQNASRMP